MWGDRTHSFSATYHQRVLVSLFGELLHALSFFTLSNILDIWRECRIYQLKSILNKARDISMMCCGKE